ncbi:hypothetical protein MSUIS_01800 [Mycoplasma suis KI3806]|nr:hypothetical protein [Mycoplasma suis]CBZ40273.1 hypothetical protein MSUIS_01800 [Mycoplasma suis KI3806]
MNYSSPSKLDSNSFESQSESLGISISPEEQLVNFLEENDINLNLKKDSTVTTLFKELVKNSQTKEIEEESSLSLETVKKSLGEHSNNFESIIQKVEEWNKKKQLSSEKPESSRGKRQTEDQEISFSPEERKSLFCFYKKFSELIEKQKGFTSQLKNVEQGSEKEASQEQTLNSENKVLKALEEIGWNEGDMTDFGEYLRGEKRGKDGSDPLLLLLEDSFLQKIRNDAVKWKGLTDSFIKGQEWQYRNGWTFGRRRDIGNSLKIFQEQTGSIEKEALFLIASKLTNDMLKASKEQ